MLPRPRARRSSSWLVGCWLFASSLAGAAGPVDDASRATARKLGYSGVEAYQAGDYRAASEKLERAYGVLKVPTVGLWSARALVKLGKLVEASERYQQVTQLSGQSGNEAVQKQALTDAASELAALTPRIPTLTVQLADATPADVSVSVDGTPIASALIGEARPLNPGAHHVEATRGTERAALELTLAEGEQKPALLRFGAGASAAAPVAPPPVAGSSAHGGLGGKRTLALVAGGVGLVAVGVGTVFGLKSKSSHDEAAKYCQGSMCTDPRGVSAGNDAHAAGNVSTIAMVAGAVCVGAGVVLWVTGRPQEESVAVSAGPGTLELGGRF